MRMIDYSGSKGKGKVSQSNSKDKIDALSYCEGLNAKTELIQALIPVVAERVKEELEKEVESLAGPKYSRKKQSWACIRWSSNPGSVYLGEQKVKIRVPRVRDRKQEREVQLPLYKQLQKRYKEDEKLLLKVLRGLSCRSYGECVEMLPGVFGLSSSSVSRRYEEASKRKLKELMERPLDRHEFVAVFIDGKRFAEDQMIIALGVTIEGEKIILGFIQAGTENERVCREFLSDLTERGLRHDDGLLFVIDGSKGIAKAIEKAFDKQTVVQRCQWHKRENVVSYLPVSLQEQFRHKLQNAYNKQSYQEARSELLNIRNQLQLINQSAVRSLDEGFEQTLTLHRLGLFKQLGISFKTSNCIESVMALVEDRTGKVDCWKNSNQKQRWLAAALVDIEPRLKKVKGYRFLPLLKNAIRAEVKRTELIA